jgi:hypothetical protein
MAEARTEALAGTTLEGAKPAASVREHPRIRRFLCMMAPA